MKKKSKTEAAKYMKNKQTNFFSFFQLPNMLTL